MKATPQRMERKPLITMYLQGKILQPSYARGLSNSISTIKATQAFTALSTFIRRKQQSYIFSDEEITEI